MARITGRSLSLEVDAAEWSGEVSSYQLASDDLPSPTFQQVEDGDAKWTLTLTVKQDMATGAAYRYLWDNAGSGGVAVTLAPYGNATPSAAQPHIPLVVTLPRKPSLGGEATFDGKPFDVQVTIDVDSVGAWLVA